MKKTGLIGLIILAIWGCTKKNTDKPSTPTDTSITGSWNTTADTLAIYDNGKLTKTYIFTGNPIQLDNIQFNSDGTLVYTSQSDPTQKTSGTYSVKNNIITFVHPPQTVNGVQQDGYSQNATIKQHTSNSLVILFDDLTTTGSVTEEDKEVVYMTK